MSALYGVHPEGREVRSGVSPISSGLDVIPKMFQTRVNPISRYISESVFLVSWRVLCVPLDTNSSM